MQRLHAMPFGAEVQDDGRVRFRLWAPAATKVELCIEEDGDEILLPLNGESDGWFGLVTEAAGSGSCYRYRIDDGLKVPDPASRFQPNDVLGPSQVVDPRAWEWTDTLWRGRPWEETVVYELHVGAFSAAGSFAGVTQRLDYLADLGITAIELMPLSDFHGTRNWGYDGVLHFAPDSSYGRPDDLKNLIQAAHRRGLMVFLDVVYNHFGPEGNFLHHYAPQFFTEHHHTPWGAAINFDAPGSETVRRFFIHNALYWLEEFHFDGLRLDAVDTIMDDSSPDILEELAAAVRQGPGRERHVHLILENDHNAVHYLRRDYNGQPPQYSAQWNDDIHHALHVLLTGETDGCYEDFKEQPVWYLGRCLAQGFGYQGEPSAYRRGISRGEHSHRLPPLAFVSFLQNHDQSGNRPFGERIDRLADPEHLRVAMAVLLLAPAPPLLFMGEEFAAAEPFQFFCDFEPELAAAVSDGRSRGYTRFKGFAELIEREPPPEPNDPATFHRCKLNWTSIDQAPHLEWLDFYRDLLALRHREIIPRLFGIGGGTGELNELGEHGFLVAWRMGDGSRLTLLANLGDAPLPVTAEELTSGEKLYAYPPEIGLESTTDGMPPWSLLWFLKLKDS
ncbi:MAG: malto-oligosyltrehalose trehalohydrolase [Chromatiaceae bacterium]|nr:malto-oligosyltrehalose trehalohydrolase [Chromatiaceae bacterium]